MAYSAGILNKRIRIHLPGQTYDTEYGRMTSAGNILDRSAAVDFSRGTKSMREGALDAYNTIMVRMRYIPLLTRDCKIEVDNIMYRIDSLHLDYGRDISQLTCSEMDTDRES